MIGMLRVRQQHWRCCGRCCVSSKARSVERRMLRTICGRREGGDGGWSIGGWGRQVWNGRVQGGRCVSRLRAFVRTSCTRLSIQGKKCRCCDCRFGIRHFLILVFVIVVVTDFVVFRFGGEGGIEARWCVGLGDWIGHWTVRGLKIGDALFEIAEIVYARLWRMGFSRETSHDGFVALYLKDGQLMHILVFACRYHVFEYTEFLIHLRPSSSFDDRVRRLPGHPLPCRACHTGLLLTCRSGRYGGDCFLSSIFGCRFRVGWAPRVFHVLWFRLHLNDLAGACGGWWKREVCACNGGLRMQGIGSVPVLAFGRNGRWR